METALKNINNLLNRLNHNNIMIVNTPNFYWNGNTITNDTTAMFKQTGTFRFNKDHTFENFLKENENNVIVIHVDNENMNFEHDMRMCIIHK